MKIYISSSWKKQNEVRLLTAILRSKEHEVVSWIENNKNSDCVDFEQWAKSEKAEQCFYFDIEGATKSDLVIYYGVAGKDSCVELGAAYASNVKIFGLWNKGEDLGLMRKVVSKWFFNIEHLLKEIEKIEIVKKLKQSDILLETLLSCVTEKDFESAIKDAFLKL